MLCLNYMELSKRYSLPCLLTRPQFFGDGDGLSHPCAGEIDPTEHTYHLADVYRAEFQLCTTGALIVYFERSGDDVGIREIDISNLSLDPSLFDRLPDRGHIGRTDREHQNSSRVKDTVYNPMLSVLFSLYCTRLF